MRQSIVGLVIFTIAIGVKGTEVDVQVASSPHSFVVRNEGQAVQPTLYVVGQTDAHAQPPKLTVGPTLNGVRLGERMLSQSVLILRPDGTGAWGYRAGFEIFPEPITLWPEHEVFYGKWKYDPLRPASVSRTFGNFLEIAVNHRPVSNVYELGFPESIRIRSVKVEASCDQRNPGYHAITRVWGDAELKHLLGETSRKENSAPQYPQVVQGLDVSRAFVEITSNGRSKWSGLYFVTLSAELDTKALKFPALSPGQNEFTYSDDVNSSHRARILFRWGKPERRPEPPIPDRLLRYKSPFAGAKPKAGVIAKLSEFFPLGLYGGIGKYPGNVVAWMMDDMLAHSCNAWYVNNLNMRRLEELVPMAEQRGLRILPQGGGWSSMYYCVGQGTPEDRKRLFELELMPAANEVVPKWRGRWGLLAWALVEEIRPEHVREVSPYYALMRELDPTHEPMVLHNNHAACVEDIALNRNPIAFHDTYPFFTECRNGPCTHVRSIAYYKKRLEQFSRTATERGVPMWVMMQAYGEPVGFHPDPPVFGYGGGVTPPGPAHLRVQVWLALAYGAKGLWWYPYRTSAPDVISPVKHDWSATPIWDEIGRIHKMVAAISGLLLRLDADAGAKLAKVNGESIFLAWHKRRGKEVGGRYVIVVNENLLKASEISVNPLDPRHEVWDLTTGKAVRAAKKTIDPGDGALFFVGPAGETPL